MENNKLYFNDLLINMQAILTEIDQLENSNLALELQILNSEGKTRKAAEMVLNENLKKLSHLKLELKEVGIKITKITTLVTINITDDQFIMKEAIQDHQLKQGMKKTILYGALAFNQIFAGPSGLPISNSMSLEKYEQYHTEKKQYTLKKSPTL